MAATRAQVKKLDDGRYLTYCLRCDSEGTFPDLSMAHDAKRVHLCEDSVASASWPGWECEGPYPTLEPGIHRHDCCEKGMGKVS